jgi:hypothetical protein
MEMTPFVASLRRARRGRGRGGGVPPSGEYLIAGVLDVDANVFFIDTCAIPRGLNDLAFMRLADDNLDVFLNTPRHCPHSSNELSKLLRGAFFFVFFCFS